MTNSTQIKISKLLRTSAISIAFLASTSCSEPSSDSGLQIVGGKRLRYKHPIAKSTVAITLGDSLLCSGVLISKQLIATAAHCFEDYPDPKDLRVHFTSKLPDNYANGASVDDYAAHEKYSFPTFDIAWLRLKDAPPKYMKPARPLLDSGALKYKTEIYLAGFGATDNDGGGLGTKLYTKSKIREYRETSDHPGLLFYGTTKGKSACYGDSGGPSFIRGPRGAWLAVGVANGPDFIVAKTDNCEAGNGIYTSFAAHWGWFTDVLPNAKPTKNSAY